MYFCTVNLHQIMFSTGQLIFAVCFFVVFVTLIIISYKKDTKLHKKHFKGSSWILLGFVFFVVLLLLAKIYLKD